MALLQCPDCGNNVSTQSPYCPRCGCPTAYIIEVGLAPVLIPGPGMPPPIPGVQKPKKPVEVHTKPTIDVPDEEPVERWDPTGGEKKPTTTKNPLAPKRTGKPQAALPENQGRTSATEPDDETPSTSVEQAAKVVPADPFAAVQGKQTVEAETQVPAGGDNPDEGAKN